jgi:phosphomethylpyrimidine synthase
MNANENFIAADAHVDAAAIAPLPNSRKIYVAGSRPDIRVPMREIAQSATADTPNPPITVYDCSGPYTDPTASIDIRKGLPQLARRLDRRARRYRGTADLSSEYGRQRAIDAELAGLRFDLARKPRRASPARMSPRCTTPEKASSRRKWNMSRSARTRSSTASKNCCASSIRARVSAPRFRA